MKTEYLNDNVSMNEQILKERVFLVVDDEVDLRDIIASELEFMGAKVYQAENITLAQKILEQNKIDLIVSDIRMPGGTGIDLLHSVKEKNVNTPSVILITGFADITPEDAYSKGTEALMNKPFKLDDLIRAVLKFTDPIEERYSGDIRGSSRNWDYQFPMSIEEKILNHELLIGRGGISVIFIPEGKKFELGEVLKFNFQFNGQGLSGVAVCRWFKTLDHLGEKASVGLEFLQLDSQTLYFFIEYWRKRSSKSFIPSFDVK